MAHVSGDRVKETSTTTGTGTLTLAGAMPKFRPFSAVAANNDTAIYGAVHQTLDEWEVGIGTWLTGNLLARTTVLASSNAGGLVNFSAGTKEVLNTPNAGFNVPLIQLAASAIPAAPAAGNLKVYTRNRAGRMTLDAIGPAGIDTSFQPALFGNDVTMWLPGTGTTVAINMGVNWTARNAGTGAAQAHPAIANTNDLTAMRRATFGTGTTATGSSGIQSGATVAMRGNTNGRGGFFFFARLGIETFASDIRVMVGLSAFNAALAGEPSAQNNSLIIGKDSGDTNWQVMARDGSAVTKTNVGLAMAANQVLDFTMFCKANDTKVTVRVVDPFSGTVYVNNVDLTANLPVNTTFLYMHAQIMSVTGVTAKLLCLNRLYLERDI